MKQLIFRGGIFAFALATTLISCMKEKIEDNSIKQSKTTSEISYDKVGPGGGIVIIRCTPHRKKFDCIDGWGLCDCEFFPDRPRSAAIQVNLLDDTTMSLFSESFVKNGEDILYVDSDLILPKEVSIANNCTSITILEGAYPKLKDNSVKVNVKISK